MVNVDVSLFIQIVNFIVLIWVLNLVLYKPIRKILIQRKEKVLALQQGAETSLEEARAREAAFDQGIKAARARGLKEKDSFLQEAGEEEKRIVGEINAKAQAEKTIVIILSGRPLIITEALPEADAWLAAWLPGSEGQGVVDLLFGEYPFIGKLPVSWPRSMDELPLPGTVCTLMSIS